MTPRLPPLLLGLALAGCGGEDRAVPFTGAIAGPGDIGRVELELRAPRAGLQDEGAGPTEPGQPIPASGRLTLSSGSTIPLAGNYDGPSETMYVSGGGYVLGAYLEHDIHPTELVLEGSYRGPSGGGRLILHEGTPPEVAVLCGTFAGSAEGRWAVVLGRHASTALAVPYASGERSRLLVGLVSAGEATYVEGFEYGESGGANATGSVTPERDAAAGYWWDGAAGGGWEAGADRCATPG
jgi:hypothetical protein